MRILWIGFGQAGGKITNTLMVLAPGETLVWLLARLQAEVWFGPEGLNIKGLIEMPVTEDQGSCSASRTEGLAFSLLIHSAQAERRMDKKNKRRPGG